MEEAMGDRALTALGYSVSPRVAYVGLALLAVAVAAALYAFDPRKPGIYPVCPFLALTGCYCPGCGTLRALHMLLNGNAAAALGYNALAALALPFVGYSYVTGALRAFGMRAPGPVFVRPVLIWGLLAVVLVFWAARNLSVGALAALAP